MRVQRGYWRRSPEVEPGSDVDGLVGHFGEARYKWWGPGSGVDRVTVVGASGQGAEGGVGSSECSGCSGQNKWEFAA